MEQHGGNQRRLTADSSSMSTSLSTATSNEIDSLVYDNKVRINHWHDKMMEHKKIYYSAELKMYQLELALAKWDNSNKLRWSVRHREMMNPVHHTDPPERPKRPKPKPAFGYVPITRTFKVDQEQWDNNDISFDGDGDRQRGKVATTVDEDERNDDEHRKEKQDSGKDKDIVPIHSEDYKPFSNTASIHSYMYHLRKIYGK